MSDTTSTENPQHGGPQRSDAKSERKLKICLVGTHFQVMSRASDRGFLWPIAKGLAFRGHHVTVLSARSPLGKSEIIRDGVRAIFIMEGLPRSVRIPFENLVYEMFLKLSKEEAFDLVHSLDATGVLIGKTKSSHKTKVAFDIEATQMAQLFSILGMSQENVRSLITNSLALLYKFVTTYFGGDRALLRSADGIFVTSPRQRIALERYYLYPEQKTFLVPYGAEVSDLLPREQTLELRQSLRLPENAHVVVAMSDMIEGHPVFNLLNAFERLAIKKPNAYLVLIGNGPKFKEIEFHILNLALGSRVIMTGPIKSKEIVDYIMLGEVFVELDSKSSGFDTPMIEAMAQKRLIIGSEVSPISYIIEDGLDGFLIRPADVASLSHLLIEIFSGTINAAEIGERARQKVVGMFEVDKMVDAIERAYFKIVD